MIEILLVGILVAVLIAALFSFFAFMAARRISPTMPLDRHAMSELLRSEGDAIRGAGEASARGLRQEIGQVLAQNQNNTVTAMVATVPSITQTG